MISGSGGLPTPPVGSTWGSMAYGNGRFLAITTFVTSTTGAILLDGSTTWTPVTLPSSANYWAFVGFGNGLFLMINSVGNVAYSTDGITWSISTFALPGTGISPSTTPVYGNGKFVIIGNDGSFDYSFAAPFP